MKGMPKRRKLLAITLIAVLAAAAWTADSETSFASEDLADGDHFAYVIGYPDGCMRPLERITREEAAVIFFRLLSKEKQNTYCSDGCPFSDLESNRWSWGKIAVLYQIGIIQGDKEGTFRPSAPLKRAEFAAMAARFSSPGNSETNMKIRFPDAEKHWSSQYIEIAAGNGWIRGYGDDSFRPDNCMIRCEAMMLVNEALDRRVDKKGLHKNARQWPDNTEDKWYYEIVLEAANSHEYQRANKPKSTEKWTGIKENPVGEEKSSPVK